MTLRSYPELSLAAARDERDKYAKILGQGRNPSIHKSESQYQAEEESLNTMNSLYRKGNIVRQSISKEINQFA